MSATGVYSSEGFRNLHTVLKNLELEKTEFTIRELATMSGYKLSSIRTYVGKKLKGFLLSPTQRGRFLVKGALILDEDAFVRHMSQKSPAVNTCTKGLSSRLSHRSLDAYFLAIELYNRPTQANRVEAFCIMMINAWELLLKAEIAGTLGESCLYYKDDPTKTIAIRDAIKKIFPRENDAIRKNIEYLTDLRDKAIHLLIPELQGHTSRLFQASVFNYLRHYNSFTGSDLTEQLGMGLISLVVDPGNFTPDILKEVYDLRTVEEIGNFMERFRQEEGNLCSIDFAIPIEYKLSLTKNEQQGDITLKSGSGGSMGILVEVPRDVDKTHPYRQNDVLIIIRNGLRETSTTSFSPYDFQAIIHKERIQNTKMTKYYYFIEKPETHRYSDALIEFIIDKIKTDGDYIERCRLSYKHHMDKKRKPRRSKFTK